MCTPGARFWVVIWSVFGINRGGNYHSHQYLSSEEDGAFREPEKKQTPVAKLATPPKQAAQCQQYVDVTS